MRSFQTNSSFFIISDRLMVLWIDVFSPLGCTGITVTFENARKLTCTDQEVCVVKRVEMIVYNVQIVVLFQHVISKTNTLHCFHSPRDVIDDPLENNKSVRCLTRQIQNYTGLI